MYRNDVVQYCIFEQGTLPPVAVAYKTFNLYWYA